MVKLKQMWLLVVSVCLQRASHVTEETHEQISHYSGPLHKLYIYQLKAITFITHL